MHRRRQLAFTLVELLVATCASAVLASIIYTVGSEGLTAFARNISINRSYSDARFSLEIISNALQSAGHVPILLDSTGVATGGALPAAGVRFYRYGFSPTYQIPGGSSSTMTLTVTVATGQTVPSIGDLVAIAQIGFQGTVTAVSCSLPSGTTNSSSATPATLSFATTITAGCVPVTTTTTSFTVTTSSAYSCQVYTQVSFIAVPPTSGTSAGITQLRYYRRAMSASATGTACGGLAAYNSATVFNNPTNYKIIASLPLNATSTQILPFQLPQVIPSPTPSSSPLPTPTPVPPALPLSVTLCAEGPDYNNRSLHTADTFTQMQTSLGSRVPALTLRGPY